MWHLPCHWHTRQLSTSLALSIAQIVKNKMGAPINALVFMLYTVIKALGWLEKKQFWISTVSVRVGHLRIASDTLGATVDWGNIYKLF